MGDGEEDDVLHSEELIGPDTVNTMPLSNVETARPSRRIPWPW